MFLVNRNLSVYYISHKSSQVKSSQRHFCLIGRSSERCLLAAITISTDPDCIGRRTPQELITHTSTHGGRRDGETEPTSRQDPVIHCRRPSLPERISRTKESTYKAMFVLGGVYCIRQGACPAPPTGYLSCV